MSGVIPWEEPLPDYNSKSSRECTCHINPPCSYCLGKLECIGCGDLVHPDDADYIQESPDREVGPFCDKCMDKILGRNLNE